MKDKKVVVAEHRGEYVDVTVYHKGGPTHYVECATKKTGRARRPIQFRGHHARHEAGRFARELYRTSERDYRKLDTKRPAPVPTGNFRLGGPCPHCGGTGRTVDTADGWRIFYRYQDGHEITPPMLEGTAVKQMREHRDPTCTATLIGPDGQVYTLDPEPKETT